MNIKDETKTDLEKYLYDKKLTRSQIEINLMQKKSLVVGYVGATFILYSYIYLFNLLLLFIVSELCDPGAQKQP